MDTVFYVVSAIVAIGLFVLIARNLWRMDKQERARLAAERDKTARK